MNDIKNTSKKVQRVKERHQKDRPRRGMFIFFMLVLSCFFGVVGGVLGAQYATPYVARIPFIGEQLVVPDEGGEVIIQKNEIVEVRDVQNLSSAIQKVSPTLVSVFDEDAKSEISGNLFTISSGVAGFALTADGLILTNKQYVSDTSKEYFVRVAGGEVYPVDRIELDPLLDVALLKIDATNLPVVEFGVSDEVMQGDKIILFGNTALESIPELFTDIISSLRFSAFTDGDAKVNGMFALSDTYAYSHSGSPITTLDGRVVGIYTKSSQGSLEYVIPVDYIKDIVSRGSGQDGIDRIALPFEYIDLDDQFSAMSTVAFNSGALITRVNDEVSDFEVGDVVYEVDGQKINPQTSFTELWVRLVNAEQVVLSVNRGGEKVEIPVQFEQ